MPRVLYRVSTNTIYYLRKIIAFKSLIPDEAIVEKEMLFQPLIKEACQVSGYNKSVGFHSTVSV